MKKGKFEDFHLVLMKQTKKNHLRQLKTFFSAEHEILSIIWKPFKTFLSFLPFFFSKLGQSFKENAIWKWKMQKASV